MSREIIAPDMITVLLCTEANSMYPQSLLLCESIRTFGGAYSDIDIVAVSPRPDLALDDMSKGRLLDLDVEYVVDDLNQTGSPYGAINRIVASAWAEQNSSREFVLALDTDTVFIDEPQFVRADVGVRPVDMKGATSRGLDDPQDKYWKAMCEIGGIDIETLPMLSTTVDKQTVRASYNGGFSIIRRNQGIFQKAKDVFIRSFESNLRPFQGFDLNITASSGAVGKTASEFWTSGQTALSIAIWAITNDVHIYDEEYNIPLNCLRAEGRTWPHRPTYRPKMLHYHHLMKPSSSLESLQDVLAKIDCPPHLSRWIVERRGLFNDFGDQS